MEFKIYDKKNKKIFSEIREDLLISTTGELFYFNKIKKELSSLGAEYVVLPYTWLQDHYGNKIYEWDVLKHIVNKELLYIKYNNPTAGYSAYNSDDSELMFGFYRIADCYKIVGNINKNKII